MKESEAQKDKRVRINNKFPTASLWGRKGTLRTNMNGSNVWSVHIDGHGPVGAKLEELDEIICKQFNPSAAHPSRCVTCDGPSEVHECPHETDECDCLVAGIPSGKLGACFAFGPSKLNDQRCTNCAWSKAAHECTGFVASSWNDSQCNVCGRMLGSHDRTGLGEPIPDDLLDFAKRVSPADHQKLVPIMEAAIAHGYYPREDHGNGLKMSPYGYDKAWQFDTVEQCIEAHRIVDEHRAKIGRKFDGGKLDWTLMPFDALEPVVRVLELGAKKYARDNWLHVENSTHRYTKALMRHVVAYVMGEENDPETGEPHLAHAGCCLLFLLSKRRTKP